jgi:phage terminase large subunit-like protein
MIRDLVRDPICVVTRGSSYENRGNLAPAFFDQIIREYQGTQARPAGARRRAARRHPRRAVVARFDRGEPTALSTGDDAIVVAIDRAVTSGEEADEAGIVVAGKDKNGHGYVLADLSGRYPPTEWARLAITAYATHGADRIVAEVNNGGDMVVASIAGPVVARSTAPAQSNRLASASIASPKVLTRSSSANRARRNLGSGFCCVAAAGRLMIGRSL